MLDIPELLYTGEEVLHVPGPEPLTDLRAKDGPGIPLLGSEVMSGEEDLMLRVWNSLCTFPIPLETLL